MMICSDTSQHKQNDKNKLIKPTSLKPAPKALDADEDGLWCESIPVFSKHASSSDINEVARSVTFKRPTGKSLEIHELLGIDKSSKSGLIAQNSEAGWLSSPQFVPQSPLHSVTTAKPSLAKHLSDSSGPQH